MHRIDGPGATVDNKFTEGDPVGSIPATVVTDDWLNAIQEELMSILAAAGVAPVKAKQDQLLESLGVLIRTQSLTAFTTAGTAPAFTLTPSPAISAYATNQRFRVRFNAGAANGTLNVSGKGAKNLKQYDSTGSKIAAVIVADMISDVEYDGTDMIVRDPLPVSSNTVGTVGAAKSLSVSTTGLSAVVTVAADEIVVESAANAYQTLRSINVAPSLASSGANGLDAGVASASTWYSVWVIWNATAVAGLLSLSATAPVMPAGYTHKARVSWVRTDATASKFPFAFKQVGRRARYVVVPGSNTTTLPFLASGVQGALTPVLVAASIGSAVPPTAGMISVQLTSPSGSWAIAAPNTTAPQSVSALQISNGAGTQTTLSADFLIESGNVGYAANGQSALYAAGWEDNL